MEAGDSRKTTLFEKKHKHEEVWSVQLFTNTFMWLDSKGMTKEGRRKC